MPVHGRLVESVDDCRFGESACGNNLGDNNFRRCQVAAGQK